MATRLTRKTVAHLRSLRATMSQKSSVPQAISFVSQVLKRDTSGARLAAGGTERNSILRMSSVEKI
jgi:hypothetical protein